MSAGKQFDVGSWSPPFEVKRAASRLKSWAVSRGTPNEVGWDGIERDVKRVTDALQPCLGHEDQIQYLNEDNKRLREDNEMLMRGLNVKERERREHRDALQAWADKYAVAKPTGKYLKRREADLWEACSALGLRVPLVAAPGPETDCTHENTRHDACSDDRYCHDCKCIIEVAGQVVEPVPLSVYQAEKAKRGSSDMDRVVEELNLPKGSGIGPVFMTIDRLRNQ